MNLSAKDKQSLLDVLAYGNVELQFNDRRSIKVHSQKLELASKVLCSLMEELLDGEVKDVQNGEVQAKRMRTDGGEGTSSALIPKDDIWQVKVGPHSHPCGHACLAEKVYILTFTV